MMPGSSALRLSTVQYHINVCSIKAVTDSGKLHIYMKRRLGPICICGDLNKY